MAKSQIFAGSAAVNLLVRRRGAVNMSSE